MNSSGLQFKVAYWPALALGGTGQYPLMILVRDHSFPRQIFPIFVGQFAKFRSSLRQIFHIYQLIFYDSRNRQNMQYLSSVSYRNWQIQSVYQINRQYFRQAQLNIFTIPPIKAQVAVMYFMVKSCIHTVQRPELHQNVPYLSPYHRPVLNSARFRENIDIPQKWANSAARLKIPHSTEYCGPYLYTTIYGKPEQQRFTIWSGVLTGTSSRRRGTISGHPLPEWMSLNPAVSA